MLREKLVNSTKLAFIDFHLNIDWVTTLKTKIDKMKYIIINEDFGRQAWQPTWIRQTNAHDFKAFKNLNKEIAYGVYTLADNPLR